MKYLIKFDTDNKLFFNNNKTVLIEYSADIFNDVKSYFKFNETSGTAVKDAIDLVDGTSAASPNANGKNGYCQYFDAGGTSKITISNKASINFSGDFSISLWCKVLSGGDSTAMMVHKNTYPEYNYRIVAFQDGKFEFGTKDTFFSTTNSYSLNNWHHIVVTSNTTTGKKIYINGTNDGTSSHTNLGSGTDDLIIGDYTAGGFKFKGYIDELAFWEKTLSQSDVTTLYNSGNGLFY